MNQEKLTRDELIILATVLKTTPVLVENAQAAIELFGKLARMIDSMENPEKREGGR